MSNFNVGDRFYFYKNCIDSDTVKVGFKGVVDGVYGDQHKWVDCEGWAFEFEEIKPIITVMAVIGDPV